MKSRKFLPIILLIVTILFFFYPAALFGKLPVPADTIIGLYHPFRDLYAKDYPRGIPFKNSLITDPVRQQYPWRYLSVYLEKNLSLPLWNPYVMAGSPLLANFQSAPFYPLNILLFLPNFNIWWSIIIILQPLLACVFMYLFLRNIKLSNYSAFLGGFVYAFSGFSIAWLEWGTIVHVALWLPLILLSIDKLVIHLDKRQILNSQFSILNLKIKKIFIWSFIFLFSLTSAFLAGHLQTFFYLFLVSIFYFLARWLQFGRSKKVLFTYIILNTCYIILTSVQWLPTLQLILQSARDVDQIPFQKEGWFLPTRHLIQFFAPDFFGNPATLNYWGVWNYGEFIGYVGVFPLIMACFALFYRYDKKTFFFGSIFFLSLFFALPTWLARLPFELQIPFLNTAQPTRLLFLTDFALSILAALGVDYFIASPKKNKMIYPLIFIFLIYLFLWAFVFFAPRGAQLLQENINIAKNNLYFPTIIFFLITLFTMLFLLIKNKNFMSRTILVIPARRFAEPSPLVFFILLMIGLTIFDLFRFGFKFTPFTDSKYLFPSAAGLSFLQKNSSLSRIMTTDARILPPNFSVMYQLESIDGYDPLYLKRYGELIAAMERSSPDIKPPFGFNRIINPYNYDSRIADLLGVKYVLSLSDLSSPKLKEVFAEGLTKIYENKNVIKRAFFVRGIYPSSSKQGSINALFDKNIDLKQIAIVENWDSGKSVFENTNNKAKITKYTGNEVIIETFNKKEGFLVLTDTFYPTWHAKICNNSQNNCVETKIYITDFNFRGILVPAGNHDVIFYNKLL